jgi:LPS export ABC transporter protein LptC
LPYHSSQASLIPSGEFTRRRSSLFRGALAGLLAGGIAACSGDDAGAVAGAELLELGAEQVAIDVRHILTSDGVLRAQLLADTAFFLNEESLVRFRGVRVHFFGDVGEEVSVLTAEEGVVNLQTEDMEATGRVVVVDREQSERLETETLEYLAESNQLSSDVEFTFYRGSNTIRGQGFVSDPGLDTVHVTQPSAVSPRRSEVP